MNPALILGMSIVLGGMLIVCWRILRTKADDPRLTDLLQQKLRSDLRPSDYQIQDLPDQPEKNESITLPSELEDESPDPHQPIEEYIEEPPKTRVVQKAIRVNIFKAESSDDFNPPPSEESNPDFILGVNEIVKKDETPKLLRVKDLIVTGNDHIPENPPPLPTLTVEAHNLEGHRVPATLGQIFPSGVPAGDRETYVPVHTQELDIPRQDLISQMVRHLSEYSLICLYGPIGSGKASLASMLAREIRFSTSQPSYSFSFGDDCHSLEDGLNHILSKQLKLDPDCTLNAVESFYQVCREMRVLFILQNVHLLPYPDQLFLLSRDSGSSKIILISESSPHGVELQPFVKAIEMPPLSGEVIRYYLQEKSSVPIVLNPPLMGRLNRLLKGSPLALRLLLAYIDLRKETGMRFEDLCGQIFEPAASRKSNVPFHLHHLLDLVIHALDQPSRKILSFVTFLPLHSFTAGLMTEIIGSDEVAGQLARLCRYGLLSRLSEESEHCQLYKPSEVARMHLYTSSTLEVECVQKAQQVIFNHCAGLLASPEMAATVDSRFLSSGLLYILTRTNLTTQLHQGDFQEKALLYLAQSAFLNKMEFSLRPIYREHFQNTSSNAEQAYLQKLLGMSQLLIAEGKSASEEKQKLLEESLKYLQNALQFYLNYPEYSSQRQPVYNLLGQAYLRLAELKDDPDLLLLGTKNLKSSIQISDTAQNPHNAIQSYLQLGRCYIRLYRQKGDVVCLSLAIEILRQVFRLYPNEWTTFQMFELRLNTGNALYSLAAHENPLSNLQAAVQEYKKALDHVTRPNERTLIYNCLGCTHWRLARYHHPIFHLESAISSYKKCMELMSIHQKLRQRDTLEQAVLLNNLGNAYRSLASEKQSSEYLSLSMSSFREALRIAERLENSKLIKMVGNHILELSNLVDRAIQGGAIEVKP